MRKFLFLFMSVWISVSCAHRISVVSAPPGADVYVLSENGTRGKALGQTPMTIRDSSKTLVGLEVTKPGYTPNFVFLPMSGQSTDLRVKVNLVATNKDWFKNALVDTQAQVLNEALLDILELQSLVVAGKDLEVEAYLKKIGNRYKRISAFHSLLGNYHYLKKRFDEAKDSYADAVDLDPGNIEAKTMLDFLNQKDGK